jgi:hypothetical protein
MHPPTARAAGFQTPNHTGDEGPQRKRDYDNIPKPTVNHIVFHNDAAKP